MSILDDIRFVERRIAALEGVLPDAPSPVSSRPESFSGLVGLVRRAAMREGVDPALAQAVAGVESGFDPHALSPAGARGLMQLMPDTAAALGVSDRDDLEQNARAGARYLHELLGRFGGDLRSAVAAYNAGPGAVERYGGIPPYAETRAYVRRVLATYQALKTSS